MKLAIAGYSGRMGQAIAALAEAEHTLIPLSREKATDLSSVDAVIDFTRPDYALTLLNEAVRQGVPFVSGTTGFSTARYNQLTEAADSIPIFWASNMSMGVALLRKLVREAARQLPESYDIEIAEMHHKDKVDAPSGTALTLGKAAAEGRDIDFETHHVLSREGETGPRQAGTIGFATLRGGRVIGDHSALFAGEHDIIELSHRSHSRAIYAEGAIRAAQWLQGKPAGMYGMDDLLRT